MKWQQCNRTALLFWVLGVCMTTVQARYTETMNPHGPVRNLKTDYSLVDDDAKSNQSDTLQKAIDELSAMGGGRLMLPQGTYRFAQIRLKSNVHLLIDKGTVIKPDWLAGTKTAVFLLDAERPAVKRKMTTEQERAYIENVTMEGFKYNTDKPILTPADARPGKWGQELRNWKAAKGISVE